MRKIFKALIGVAAFLGVFAATVHGVFNEAGSYIEDTIAVEIPGDEVEVQAAQQAVYSGSIACWGDSITFGLGYGEAQVEEDGELLDISNWTYPSTLEYYTGLDVYNLGVSGETSYEIAVRSSGIKMYIGKQVTLKGSKSAPVVIVDENGDNVELDNFNGYGSDNGEVENLVYIGDDLFQILKQNGQLYIKRYGDNLKGSVKLKKGMQIVTKAAHDVKAEVMIIQMGSNGGWSSYDELIGQYRAIIENSGVQKYIIVGDTDNPVEAYDSWQYEADEEVGINDTAWEAALREAFGEHFINMRTYILQYGMDIAGLEPTQEDMADLEQGRIPMQLKDDYTHFNSYGYYVMGKAVYAKGIELGYW